ncbi:MAG TPA: ImmA/IrrE family metallo-endopeptidase [Parafilimonas sp.]|nr:ImmA/IrrE family metallo-endopeptidase [Parafilimonas sp.]
MEVLITHNIKKEVLTITEVLSSTFSYKRRTDLLLICKDEGISLILDNYQHYFDGMLVWDGSRFMIHLNTGRGNNIGNKRGRFTIAHELGHYFINSHREGIKSGNIPMHASSNSLAHSDKIESEADYFAANLLMPTEKLRALTARRKFSLEIIKEVSEEFDVSITSALLRFANVGTHSIMVVFSEGNVVKWSVRSDDFPKLVNKFKISGPLPPTSVAGESFLKSNAQYTGIEQVDLEDWFVYKGWEPLGRLYEQCFYSDLYNYVISLLWFDK